MDEKHFNLNPFLLKFSLHFIGIVCIVCIVFRYFVEETVFFLLARLENNFHLK